MGGCFSSPNVGPSDLLCCVFGLVGSGKSTFTKQLRVMDNQGWSNEELANFSCMIRRDIMVCFQDLIRICETDKFDLSNENLKRARFVLTLDVNGDLADWWDDDIPRRVLSLWKDKAIKKAFNQSSQFNNLTYFIERLPVVASKDYVPINDDILRLRMRTSTVTTTKISTGKYNLSFIDCGGQKSEREKWINILNSSPVHSVIFVVALDEYNIVSQENEKQTKLQQSLEIFHKLLQDQDQKQTYCIVLLFNKIDLFRPKFKKDPKSVHASFPECPTKSEAEVLSYFEARFKEKLPPHFQLTCLTLCSLDIDLTKLVFEEIKKFAISSRIKKSGLAMS